MCCVDVIRDNAHALLPPPPPSPCVDATRQTVTGHKCYHPGYEEFNPPSWGSECAPNKSDWIDLSIDYCGDNEWNLAEEFWACSDIAITAGA